MIAVPSSFSNGTAIFAKNYLDNCERFVIILYRNKGVAIAYARRCQQHRACPWRRQNQQDLSHHRMMDKSLFLFIK